MKEFKEEDSSLRPDFGKSPDGLLPVITQEAGSGEILMQAYMNEEAWEKTLESGFAVYYSRSRKKLWLKGESSGHKQRVQNIFLDCDRDSILIRVDIAGGIACHTGRKSCFFYEVPLRTE